jgi:hypothetical protein
MTVEGGRPSRVGVLVAMQRALWDQVTPELRGVAVSWAEALVAARFLYDLPITDDLEGLVGEVETEVLTDFAPDVRSVFRTEHLPSPLPRTLLSGEAWVYLRKEN